MVRLGTAGAVLLPRARVHEWSIWIDADWLAHARRVHELLVLQHRVATYLQACPFRSGSTDAQGVAVALLGSVLRIFDLAGGTLEPAAAEDLRSARRRVASLSARSDLAGGDLPARARSVPRAQPHVLDEILYTLFDRPSPESPLDDGDRVELYGRLWIAVEAIAPRWRPPDDFVGEERTYVFTPVG